MIIDCFLEVIAKRLCLEGIDIKMIYEKLNQIKRTGEPINNVTSMDAGKYLLLLKMLDKGKIPKGRDYKEFEGDL